MEIPSEIRFKNERLKKNLYQLKQGNDFERKLFENINNALQNIENNIFCGIIIKKKLIPKEYNVNNLWKYNLPDGWRLMYSIERDEIIVVSIVLEWLDHKKYERRFKF